MKKTKVYVSKMIKVSLAALLGFTVLQGLNGVYADQNDGTQTLTATEAGTESPASDAEGESKSADDAGLTEDPKTPLDSANEEQSEAIVENEPIQYFTVSFFDYDGTPLAEAQQVEAGKSAVAPSHPVRDGFEAAGWDTDFSAVNSDLNVTAVYRELLSYTVTVNYIFQVSYETAAQPFVAVVKEHDPYTVSVEELPIVNGYHAVDASGSTITSYSASYVDITENINVDIYYVADGETSYKVEHYLEALDGSYVLADTDYLSASTGSAVTASAKTYTGFSAPAMPSAKVAADASTVLKVEYSRNEYLLSYVTEGSSIEPQILTYGMPLEEPEEPTREGYEFDGWYTDKECRNEFDFDDDTTMPASDLTLYAGWDEDEASYQVVVWLEKADSKNNDVYEYATTLVFEGETGVITNLPDIDSIKNKYTFAIGNENVGEISKDKSDTTVYIKGDGSSIANIYVNRKEYSINMYVKKNSNPNENANWNAFYKLAETITANYGADITDEWNTAAAKIKESKGTLVWVRNTPLNAGSTDNPVIPPIYKMTNDENLFYVNNGSDPHKIELWVERLDNTATVIPMVHTGKWSAAQTFAYSKDTSIFTEYQDIYFSGTGIHAAVDDYKAVLEGYTWVGADLSTNEGLFWDSGYYTARHYYVRNQYQITYDNNTVLTYSDKIKYGASLTDMNVTPLNKAAGVPSEAVFEGWYLTSTFEPGTEFDFSGSTMPAHDIKLYAKWIMPTYEVSFDTKADGITVETQTVRMYSKAAEPDAPVRNGYVFSGWYDKSTGRRFSFTTSIERDVVLEAHWIENTSIPYTVKYLDESGKELADSNIVTGNRIGSSVTETALSIDGYIPDVRSKSINIAAENNEIVFTYAEFTSADYTIKYVDKSGKELLAPVTKTSEAQRVTENYVNIPGYIPNYYQQSLDLSLTASENVITFVYAIYDTTATYKVEYYLQNLGGVGYTLNDTVSENSSVGNTVSADIKEYTGFTYASSISLAKGVVYQHEETEKGLVLRIYYNRTKVTVDFSAGENGKLNGQSQYSVLYGTAFNAVTVPEPVADKGYKFDSWTPVLPEGTSTVTSNQSYKAVFVKDDAQWLSVAYKAGSGTGTEASDTDLLIDSSYTVKTAKELGFAKKNWTFTGWKDASGKDIAEGSEIAIKENTVLTAQYKENSSAKITYYANADGAEGTITDSEKYYKGNTITVKSESGLSYEGYTFTGWNDDPQGNGKSYAAGDTITSDGTSSYALYAQWKLDESKWITVNYESGIGSDTVEGKTYSYSVLRSKAYTAIAFADLFSLKNHFHFTEWTDGTNAIADKGTVQFKNASSITLTAVFTEDEKYQIAYNANGGTGTTSDEAQYYKGDIAELKDNGFAGEDASDIFLGYSIEQIAKLEYGDALDKELYAEKSSYTVQSNTVFYAVWAADTDKDSVPDYTEYKITYLPGEGEGTVTDNTLYALNETATVKPSEGMSKKNAHFTGWQLSNWTNIQPGDKFTMNGNVVLTAQWADTEVQYVTEYYWQNTEDDNYSLHETTDAVTGKAGDSVAAEEKTYTGLTLDKTVTGTIAKAELPNDASSVIVMKLYYTRNIKTVTFKDYNDAILSENDYRYGTLADKIVKPENPARAEDDNNIYTFTGWTPDFTYVTEDAVYTAVYENTPKQHITAIDATKVYDGQSLGVTLKGELDEVTLHYSLDGKTFTEEPITVTNVSEGTVKVYVKAVREGYVDQVVSANISITPRDVQIAANNLTVNFNETPVFTGIVTGLVNETDLGTISYVYDDGKDSTVPTAVGTYKDSIVPTYSDNENYTVKTAKGTYIIQELNTLVVNADNVSVIYDGQEHTVEAKASIDGEPTEADITYKQEDGTYAETAPVFTDAGTYTVAFKAEKEGYAAAAGQATVTIDYKPITVTADDKSMTAGDAAPEYTATIEGRINEKDPLTVVFAVPQNPTVGTHVIEVQGKEIQGNYKVTYVNGTLTVKAVIIPAVDPEEPIVTEPETVTPEPAAPVINYPTNPGNPQPAAVEEAVNEEEAKDIIVKEYGEPEQPAFGNTADSWALLNLLLTGLSLVFAIVLLLGRNKKETETEDETEVQYDEEGEVIPETYQRKKAWKAVLAVIAVLQIILFIFTENITKTMVLSDGWTLLNAIITAAAVLLFIYAKKWNKEDKDEEESANA